MMKFHFDLFPRGVLSSLALVSAICAPVLASAAIAPDGSVPKTGSDLAHHMPSTWEIGAINRQIWVSPQGKGDGSSRENALGSIQAAADAATPGTVVLVESGTYLGSLLIGKSGTDKKPILFVSADGLGKAVIDSNGSGKTTIRAGKIANIGIVGFQVVGSGSRDEGDESPIKVGGNLGNPQMPSQNWFIAGNTITGTGRDGMKSYGSRNIYWFGNTLTGSWGQEACDNVTVGVTDPATDQNQFAFNTVRGRANYSAITMKMGSNHWLVFNNDIDFPTGIGFRVGGDGDLTRFIKAGRYPDIKAEPAFGTFTAKQVRVLFNRLSGKIGMGIQLYGAVDCEVRHNDLTGLKTKREIVCKSTKEMLEPPRSIKPEHNLIAQNRLRMPSEVLKSCENPQDQSVSGNGPDVPFQYAVGAGEVAPVLEKLIASLKSLPAANASQSEK